MTLKLTTRFRAHFELSLIPYPIRVLARQTVPQAHDVQHPSPPALRLFSNKNSTSQKRFKSKNKPNSHNKFSLTNHAILIHPGNFSYYAN